jgi:hypothetical protein
MGRYQAMLEILSKVHDVLTQNVLSKIWAFLLVSRVEFMVMGIPVIAISALLAASRPDDLIGDGAVRLGLLTGVWYLAYWISSQVNCIADYELDKRSVVSLNFCKLVSHWKRRAIVLQDG